MNVFAVWCVCVCSSIRVLYCVRLYFVLLRVRVSVCVYVEHVCPYGCQNSIKINKLSGSSLLAAKNKNFYYLKKILIN